MKTRLLIAGTLTAAAMLVGTVSLAHSFEDPAKHVERMTKVLDLYDDQIPQVQAIFEESRAKIEQIRDTHTLNQRKQAHEAMKAVREDTHKRLAEVLTAEQMEKLEAHHAQKRERAGKHHSKRHGKHHDKHDAPAYD